MVVSNDVLSRQSSKVSKLFSTDKDINSHYGNQKRAILIQTTNIDNDSRPMSGGVKS